jgi:hypothetical protein
MRALAFLMLVAPLHYLLACVAAVLAAFILPTDIVLQALIALLLFALGVWIGVPVLAKILGVHMEANQRGVAVGMGLGCGIAALALTVSGITTPAQAAGLTIAVLICTYTWFIRTLLRG